MTARLLLGLTACLTLWTAGPMTAVRAQTVSETTPIVIGQSFVIDSAIMDQGREINVWLPPGYGEGDQTYPVLYLLDGGQAQDFHHISGLAQLGAMSGMTQAMIVVGVTSMDRQNELAGPTTDPEMVARYPNHGQSDRFRRFLAEEVMPVIQNRYRTDGETALMGESLAALFVVETFLNQPTVFDRYIAISPSLWWADEGLSKSASGLLSTHPAGDRTLLLTIADEGGTMQSGMDRLVAALEQDAPEGLTWRYEPRHQETHATIYHGAAFDYLRQIYPLPAEDRAP